MVSPLDEKTVFDDLESTLAHVANIKRLFPGDGWVAPRAC